MMEQVIDRLRQGDERAFEALFRAFFPAGWRYLGSFRVDRDTANDIIQELFLQIWNKRHLFENERHFKSYFYKSLKNNTIKYLSRQKKGIDLAHIPEEHHQTDDFFLRIVEVEFNREVARAVAVLPEKRREVILHSIAGLSVEEIAQKLHVSINTVKAQKRKAYATLREKLKDINPFILFLIVF